MHPLPTCLDELVWDLAHLPRLQQASRHLQLVNRLIECSTIPEIEAMRGDCRTSALCGFLGEAHRSDVLDLIEGHLALRRLRLIGRVPNPGIVPLG